MKIIGKSKNGCILEATDEEMAEIQGLYLHDFTPEIGSSIDVSGLFNKYINVAIAFDNIKKLRNTADIINKAADWVEQFNKEK